MERTVRRLAAVLAADVVGYSGKIEADESSTLAALRDLQATTIDPLLAENSGRIVKTMGDGFIAEFGSVVDAVTFAVAMQKSASERQLGTAPEKRLVYRIGINLGDVVVEGDDLLGDGVNVAARLEQLCKPGGILISGTAFDQLQGKLGLPLDFTGEQQVKNISRSVRTYAVRLDGSAPGWRRALPRYVKRARPAIAAALAALIGRRRKLVVCAPRGALVGPVHRRHAVRGRGRRRGDRSPRSGHRQRHFDRLFAHTQPRCHRQFHD